MVHNEIIWALCDVNQPDRLTERALRKTEWRAWKGEGECKWRWNGMRELGVRSRGGGECEHRGRWGSWSGGGGENGRKGRQNGCVSDENLENI